MTTVHVHESKQVGVANSSNSSQFRSERNLRELELNETELQNAHSIQSKRFKFQNRVDSRVCRVYELYCKMKVDETFQAAYERLW